MEELLRSEIEKIEKEAEVIENKMKKLIEKNGISCIEKLNMLDQDTNIKYAQVFKLKEVLNKMDLVGNSNINENVYTYRLNMSYEDESMEDGLGWDNVYITSNIKYSKNEFDNICLEAIEKCRDKNNCVEIFGVEEILKVDYNFKSLAINEFFDFEEE